jgi:hypothetical protein
MVIQSAEKIIKTKKLTTMNPNLSIILQNRKACKKILDYLTTEQVNEIPEGFNNNIVWNCGHIIVVQQMLTYGLTDIPMSVSDELFKEFRPGSKPEKYYDQDEVENIKKLFFSTHEQFMDDLSAGKMNTIKPFMTALKFEITDITTAIAFDQYHEALHMGCILSLMKRV